MGNYVLSVVVVGCLGLLVVVVCKSVRVYSTCVRVCALESLSVKRHRENMTAHSIQKNGT